ncbi:MAG: hypothetical protein JSS49_03585 [Planctomycetes bacterium]|nr:hypothetical protein [Planctomycetota bacterium]
MFAGVLALLSRSLRMDVRSRGMHVARLGLLVLIYLSIVQVHVLSIGMSAPGLSLFKSILFLNLVFLTLLGIGSFSSAITEEKEEDSLGLLQMAGVNSVGLILGKVGGRLVQVLTLLIVEYPFALLSITLGGVSGAQISAAYISMAAYAILLAAIGVFWSTVCQNSRGSSRATLITLILYWLIPLYCGWWVDSTVASGISNGFLPVLSVIAKSCIFLQTSEILTTGYSSPFGNVQVVSNLLGGVAAFGLAWLVFDVCSRQPKSEPMSRGLVSRSTGRWKLFKPGRVTLDALVWKDYHFVAGGVSGLLVRTGFYLAFFGLVYYLNSPNDISESCVIFLMSEFAILPIDASLLISRAMQDEVRGQTISSLVMLPRSVPKIVYPKLAGALLGLVPGVTFGLVAFACSGLVQTWLRSSDWEVGYVVFFFIPHLLLLPHLTAVIALVVRWGATPLAIGAMYAIQMVESMVLAVLFVVLGALSGGGGGAEMAYGILLLMVVVNIALCVGCHFEVLRRFRKLSEK